jgi:predicted SnoaL-like aldol condensation-catalyzing enzyme
VSSEQNKAVVHRFMTDVLQGGNVDVVDEVLAPTYVNPAMGGADLPGFKAILTGMAAAGIGLHFSNVGLIADGDDVVARFTLEVTRTGAEKLAAQGLTYYRLADGKIIEDDPFTRPDLGQLLGMTPPVA